MKQKFEAFSLRNMSSHGYRFFLIFIFSLANFGGRFNPQILRATDLSERLLIFGSFVFIALVSSAIILAITVSAESTFKRLSSGYLFSAGVMLLSLAVVFTFLKLFEPINSSLFGFAVGSLGASPLYRAINLILGSLILTAIFRYERKILERLASAKRISKQLRASQKQLIEAEEQQKGQTSRFLHDRVQADLMVISMQLATIEKETTGSTFESLEAIRARLEKLRRIDLRLVGNALQPNVKDLGLKSAVEDLIEQFSSGMNFDIQIDDSAIRSNTQLCLGLYRIIEQAILNSITHGPASNVIIKVAVTDETQCNLTIKDDGPGATTDEIEAGFGTVLIDSWVSILNATKEVRSKPGEGYSLNVTIPL